jgi:uncharacterized membrane protein
MDTVKYILFSSLISVLFVIPGILFDTWLSKIGVVRSSKGAVVITTILLVFTKPFLFKEASWWVFSIFILLGITLGVQYIDLRETYIHGAWWWKKEKKNRRKSS